jgi:hypothetical protein
MTTTERVIAELDQVIAERDQYHNSRDTHMKAAAALARRLHDLQASHDHLLRESRLTAEALVLAHERRDEALADLERLREANAELRCRIQELEGAEDDN